MRQRELQDDEERMKKKQDLSSCSRSMVIEDIECSLAGGTHITSLSYLGVLLYFIDWKAKILLSCFCSLYEMLFIFMENLFHFLCCSSFCLCSEVVVSLGALLMVASYKKFRKHHSLIYFSFFLWLCLEAPFRVSHAQGEEVVSDVACAPSVSRCIPPLRSNRWLVFHDCFCATYFLVTKWRFWKITFCNCDMMLLFLVQLLINNRFLALK